MERLHPATMSHRGAALDRGLWVVALGFVAIEAAWAPGLTPLHLAVAAVLFLALGLPHGALDAWIWRRALPGAPRALFFAGYFALMGLVVGAWVASPRFALWAFLLLAVHHFGEADIVAAHARPGERALLRCTRGALVVGVPIALHPDAVQPVVSAMGVPGFGFDSPGSWRFAAIMMAAHLAALAGTRALPVRSRMHEAAQALVLATMFAVLHPLLSFALYFTLWHALGHLNELRTRWRASARPRRLVVRGAPFAVAATVGLFAFVEAAPGPMNASVWAGRALVVTSVLTLPHALLVTLMRSGALGSVARRLSASRFAAGPGRRDRSTWIGRLRLGDASR